MTTPQASALAIGITGLLVLAGAAASAQTPPAQPPPPPGPALWQARATVELRVLDKVNARAVSFSGRVGQVFKYGFLTVSARACVVPPPDIPADSAAFLDIVDSRPDAPRFHAWMFASHPSVSMLEHPIYDVRVTACR